MEEQSPEVLLRKYLLEWKEGLVNEVGTEPPCPFCRKPRVKRSDYIRCNPCGTNWLDGEDISRDPRAERMRATASIATARSGGAPTAGKTSD